MRKAKKSTDVGAIPINPLDVKRITEVPFKEKVAVETIEKPGIISAEKLPRKRTSTGKAGRKTKRKISEAEEPARRGKGEYILIITEKPQAADKIANALGSARKISGFGVPYYEVSRDGEKIVVAAAAGHLFTLVQKTRGQTPVFDLEWKPSYEKKAAFTKKFYDVLKKLCRNAKSFIVATDYDVEGEVIGWNILRFICGQEDAKRMKYSTLTSSELNQAYENLMPSLNWGQAIAGETRHYLDWMYGINLSRALMESIKKAGSFKIMSIGRVQGPALRLVVDKELEINAFKPSPFWQVFIWIDDVQLKYIKDITDKKELEKFNGLKGKTADVKTITREENILPPAPFDLTTLQTEAYKFFKINPARTLQIAQRLYLAGLISYPRTSSQKIPQSIMHRKIIEKLKSKFEIVKYVAREKPVEGSKSDPAHPSIYPTGEYEELYGEDKKIYELIVKRFISCFCSDALVENKTIAAAINKLKFFVKGLQIKEKGWMNVYTAYLQEKKLPDMNGPAKIEKLRQEEKMTQPPKRYTPASLISELSKKNLGTKSTRAAIIETLYNRGYIREQSIEATPLGISLISTLEKHSPIIIDEKLTRRFEKGMNDIQTTKKNLQEKEKQVIEEAKKVITEISKEFKISEDKVGKELVEANNNLREEEKEKNKLVLCPVCKKGQLAITFSRKTKKKFVACDKYPECKTTFSLPQNGLIKKTGKQCECGFPLLMLIRKGRRPWTFCFNPNCKTRQDRQGNNGGQESTEDKGNSNEKEENKE